jgi:hypothetical protein
MTVDQIDVLAKSVASQKSRRDVLKKSAAVAAGGVVVMTGAGIAAAGNGHGYGRTKVWVCHRRRNAENSWKLIHVGGPARKAHEKHGDRVVEGEVVDGVIQTDVNNCGSCGVVCSAVSGECYVPTCVAGDCGEAPAAAGTACSVGFCDGAGVCAP